MVTMGIIELDISPEEVEKLTSLRNTELSAIREEMAKITKDSYFYEITDYVKDLPENERMKRAKRIATQLQNASKVSTKALQKIVKGNTLYVLSVDKKRKIVQPDWLKGKQKTKADKKAGKTA